MPGAGTPFNEVFPTFLWFSIAIGVFVAVWLCLNLILFRTPKGTKRRRPKDAPKPGMFPHHRGNLRLELLWTVIPSLIVAYLTFATLAPLDEVWGTPDNPVRIQVTGSQWVWAFTYENGTTSYAHLDVRCGVAYEARITSTDVIHSLFIPQYGVKEDAVRGVDTKLTFTPTETGTFPILCAEYCGLSHAAMQATLTVHGPCPSG